MLITIDFDQIKTLPKPPVLIKSCEGECCGILKSGKVLKDIQTYEQPDSKSKKLQIIKKDQLIDSGKTEFYIRLENYGSFVMNGKKMEVIQYLGEGNILAWDGKKSYYPNECIACEDVKKKFQYQPAKTEAWTKIYYNNKSSWTNEANLDYGWCE